MKHEKVYILTDGCMWEINKATGNEHPHAVEVLDIETGAIRYIKSGSRIRFLEGEISDYRTQKTYNSQTDYTPPMPNIGQDMPDRKQRKRKGKRGKGDDKTKGV